MDRKNSAIRGTDSDVIEAPFTSFPDSTPTDENKENDEATTESSTLFNSVTQQNASLNNHLIDSITPSAPPATDAQVTPAAAPAPSAAPAPASRASSADDNCETRFVYVLRQYDSISDSRVHSPWHYFGGFKWRLLIFPKGNQSSNHDLSVYLECGGPIVKNEVAPQSASNRAPPNGKESVMDPIPSHAWNRPAKFSLHLVHPSSPVARVALDSDIRFSDPPAVADSDLLDSALSHHPMQQSPRDVVKETSHIFRKNVSDWGFLEFAPFSNLQPGRYADDDMNVVLMVKIRLEETPIDPAFSNTAPWDSRKETGFVGFKNQGATCYMNSLLQTLYMLSAFRKAVYNMPLPGPLNEDAGSELSYALQKVFYELQFSPTVVKTKKLTESFGWDTTDAFTQHDVQELKLILCDELAEKMKKIAPNQPDTLSTLFQGKILNYIECVNVPYKSTREEEFSDLSLNVKGCRNIYESFEKYTEVEMMDGDNKYRADGFEELQDARKGVKFLKLPPVLQLHLKRFEYDTTRDAMVKINDRYEFGTEIDLSCFVEGSNGDDKYSLHSVLVHIGDVNGGHYHAYIRPEVDTIENSNRKPSQWYKFDDETVTPATEEAAVQENFGFGGEIDLKRRVGGGLEDDLGNGGINGQNHPPVFPNRPRNYQPRRLSNAYMLQYLRKSDLHYLLTPTDEKDVPKELAARILKEREEEEQRKRDNTERHLYMSLSIATDRDMIEHPGADLVNWEKVRSLNVKRTTQVGELKLILQKENIIRDSRHVRLWKCSSRQNQTIRPDSLLAYGEDSAPIDCNYRDSVTHGYYNVPLYTGRHGYYGHEDVLRLYAEDLCSQYYLSAGFTCFSPGKDDKCKELLSMDTVEHDKHESKDNMDTDSIGPRDVFPTFYQKSGLETLLFLKYYVSRPVPRLQCLGHFIADRTTIVRDLYPLLRSALAKFCEIDGSLPPATEDAPFRIYEEVCVTNVKALSNDKSLEAHQIPCDSGSGGDIIVFQEDTAGPIKEDSHAGLGQESTLEVNGLNYKAIDANDKVLQWNGFQEESRGDGTDLPLGGRPLPIVTMYYDYLAFRVKIEFKERPSVNQGEVVKSIFFELSRNDTYRVARKVLSGALGSGVDPDYLRFFSHDLNREAPVLDAFRVSDDETLDRLVSLHSLLSSTQPEYRIIWYEKTEYHISEFDKNDEVRIVWRPDGGAKSTGYLTKSGAKAGAIVGNGSKLDPAKNSDENIKDGQDVDSSNAETKGSVGNNPNSGTKLSKTVVQNFSVLVPPPPKYEDVMEEVRSKLFIDRSVELRMMEVKSNKIVRIIDAVESVPALMIGSHDYGSELRVEPVPCDETAEALGDDFDLIPVAHLAKDKSGRTWRGLVLFGDPFLIKVVRIGEPVERIRERIREKIGVPAAEFETWTLSEISQLKSVALEIGTLFRPRCSDAMEYCSLAIEHKNTMPTKQTPSSISRYADKPLKIRS